MIKLTYEYIPNQEAIREHIQDCEGMHTQQAVYSTFHDALTQICYGCLKVRSSIYRVGLEAEPVMNITMDNTNSPKPKKYKVTLRTGESAVFPNENNSPDYPSRLVSGIYYIVNSKGKNVLIIPQNVESIVEVEE